MTEQPEQFRSHFLVGTIRHRRDRFVTSDFTHHVWYLALDLDEQTKVARALPLLSFNRRNLLELRDVDHLDGGIKGLRANISERLLAHGFDPTMMRITLIAYPRVLGYVFNPVSFYLCHDAADTLRVVLAEVHNTHGDRQVYEFLQDAGDGLMFRGTQDKRMYVSPFIAADAHYELLVREDDERLAVTIRENERDELVLVAQLQVRRVPLTNRNLLRLLARDPLVPVKTSALIFWHAIRLWWRGVPWHRYRRNPDQADRPTTETTMYRRREVSPEADLPGSRPELPSGTARPPYGGN